MLNLSIYSLFLSKEEIQLAKDRLERAGNKVEAGNPLTKKNFKKVFTGWKVYVLTLWAVLSVFLSCLWDRLMHTTNSGLIGSGTPLPIQVSFAPLD